MPDPAVPARATRDLRYFTPARVALGRSGASLPTKPLLDFTLDHARARDAVHAVFDAARLAAELGEVGLSPVAASSRAVDRRDYLRRPDLGRQLDASSAEALARNATEPGRLAIVIGDGLSPAAVHAHAAALMKSLLLRLAAGDPVAIGHVVVASGARVALGDEIGAILGARMVVMLIGERPGLSVPDSLGAYLTFAPKPGRTDAERNCVSNIHHGGLSHYEAAVKIDWLVREGLARRVTGVALKDESGDRAPRRIGTVLIEGTESGAKMSSS
ncbi:MULTISPECIES: ethanolamine ammonia-lyase subunit EutC [unclassified Bradyrhizobium]|uniref:ethanolamine ammonia-lyase subunit EutC n=1 Tax=unclassified Bradyrhizobium TaxID=2631580 RepID=UPI002479CAB7|nr:MULTISPECIES: ethanolamine ammonia-lyase subunit EutC [unclassified Bradyrhizobium]WGR69042.1 ethanolamine ammonia-lyase subunit EutC [Bradyrhizobium sp. ISRA426]WGR81097.1 ethanolamine ammonia-lyase subunit EutC [Bradyrhizobium sp. ISRA430]WGR84281.1 ethanolamine ammonia-lyase subunit EutC [Bradyrhizobium sp. ISRA432]